MDEEDIELEESEETAECFEPDPFDVWRDNNPDEWERILGR